MAAEKKHKVVSVIILLAVIIIIAAGGYIGYTYVIGDVNGSRGDNREYNLVIEKEDFEYQIGEKLKSNGIIKSDTVWSWWMEKNYPDFTFINGEYSLNSSMSYSEIAEKLQNPDISHKTISVCIPEGYTVFDIGETLEKNNICSKTDFLEACKSTTDYDYDFLKELYTSENVAYQLEGFLFPATYDFSENSEAQDVVEYMLEVFDSKITKKWNSYCEQNDMTLYELITLASIVEKETLGDGVAENIASVFINRLNSGQQLQSDVTIFYGNELRENGFDDTVVESYNTYKCAALPSGPICNPGVENINAVVNHTDTQYYYFFSDLQDEFHFAETYEEFEQLKEKFPWE